MVVPGARMPADLIADEDVAMSLPELEQIDDGLAAIVDVVAGQVLALFRCLAAGLRPDGPSPDGIINRVVPGFPIYR
jgi:tagatose-6-phosphate ketose/aldose isomerase